MTDLKVVAYIYVYTPIGDRVPSLFAIMRKLFLFYRIASVAIMIISTLEIGGSKKEIL